MFQKVTIFRLKVLVWGWTNAPIYDWIHQIRDHNQYMLMKIKHYSGRNIYITHDNMLGMMWNQSIKKYQGIKFWPKYSHICQNWCWPTSCM